MALRLQQGMVALCVMALLFAGVVATDPTPTAAAQGVAEQVDQTPDRAERQTSRAIEHSRRSGRRGVRVPAGDEVRGVVVVSSDPSPLDPIDRGPAALALVPIQPEELGFTISFTVGDSNYGGLTFPHERRIEIFVRPDFDDDQLAHVIAHEIGHAVDVVRNDTADRERWRTARGIAPDVGWWADAYTADFDAPSGDFAECFAAWAVGTVPTRSGFGPCDGTGPLVAELASG